MLEEVNSPSEEEQAKVRRGCYDILGDDGISLLADYLLAHKQSKVTLVNPTIPDTATEYHASRARHPKKMVPNWLSHLQRQRRGDGPWGFVVFRSACYDGDDDNIKRWQDFTTMFQQIIEIAFARDAELDGVADAKAQFQLRWVEDPQLATADGETLRAEYARLLPSLSSGLSQEVFLWVTPDVVASVLDAADSDELPTVDSKRWRPAPPYVLVVADSVDLGDLEEDDPERDYFKPVFKAAIEVLVDELWWVLDSQIIPLRRLTRSVKAVGEEGVTESQRNDLEDVWWSTAPSPARMSRRRGL